MSTLITFDPNKTSDWMDSKGWTSFSHDGVQDWEARKMVTEASDAGLFGDVIVRLLNQHADQTMVVVTVKNPAVVTRVVSPIFDAAETFQIDPDTDDSDAMLTMLAMVAEMAAEALAPLTSYVVSWSGGYEAPSFTQHATLAAANAQITAWAADGSLNDEDELQILEVVAGSPTLNVVASGSRNENGEHVMVALA